MHQNILLITCKDQGVLTYLWPVGMPIDLVVEKDKRLEKIVKNEVFRRVSEIIAEDEQAIVQNLNNMSFAFEDDMEQATPELDAKFNELCKRLKMNDSDDEEEDDLNGWDM